MMTRGITIEDDMGNLESGRYVLSPLYAFRLNSDILCSILACDRQKENHQNLGIAFLCHIVREIRNYPLARNVSSDEQTGAHRHHRVAPYASAFGYGFKPPKCAQATIVFLCHTCNFLRWISALTARKHGVISIRFPSISVKR